MNLLYLEESHSISAFEKKLLTILEEVKGHVIQNTKLLNTLIKKGDKPTEGNEIPEGINLPVTTREEFESLEATLQNEDAGKKLVSFLYKSYKLKTHNTQLNGHCT